MVPDGRFIPGIICSRSFERSAKPAFSFLGSSFLAGTPRFWRRRPSSACNGC
jgi:hypothetical protein